MSRYWARKTPPEEYNYYYTQGNIFHQYGLGLPNCTAYAWGRFYEISGTYPNLSTKDAERWYDYNDGYERGQTPKLGAVACWRKGSATSDADGSGHVAIVEEIAPDGTINTSNSAYGGSYFYLKTIEPPYTLSGYTFQGFIYNPIDFGKIPLWLLFKFNDWRLKHC